MFENQDTRAITLLTVSNMDTKRPLCLRTSGNLEGEL
jgi:hypothetical protein